MTYSYKANFFEAWTPEMAYILGFISADGWISIDKNKGSYKVGVFIHEKDIEVIHFIKDSMKLTHPIKMKQNRSQSGLEICSKKLVSDLQQLGLSPKKSKTIQSPKSMPSNMRSHYVRGVFDGDGWVTVRDDYFNCGIVSASKKYISEIQQIADCGGRIYERQKTSGFGRKDGRISTLYHIKYSKQDSIRFRDFLYQDDVFSLSRKKELFHDKRVRMKNNQWTQEDIDFLLHYWNKPIKWLSEKLDRSEGTIIQKRFRINAASNS